MPMVETFMAAICDIIMTCEARNFMTTLIEFNTLRILEHKDFAVLFRERKDQKQPDGKR